MRHKKFKLSALVLLVLGITVLQAYSQTLYVLEKNGTQTGFSLTDISKISFSEGNMIMTDASGVTNNYSLAGVRYMNFIDLSTSVEEIESDKSFAVKVYPNPVNAVLNIQMNSNEFSKLDVEIFSLDGKMLLRKQQMDSKAVNQVDLSFLRTGIYLCKVSSGENIQITKLIKQ